MIYWLAFGLWNRLKAIEVDTIMVNHIDMNRAQFIAQHAFRQKCWPLMPSKVPSPYTARLPTYQECKALLKMARHEISLLPKYPDPSMNMSDVPLLKLHSWVVEALIAIAWHALPFENTIVMYGSNYAWACAVIIDSSGEDEGIAAIQKFDPDYVTDQPFDPRGLIVSMEKVVQELQKQSSDTDLIAACICATSILKELHAKKQNLDAINGTA